MLVFVRNEPTKAQRNAGNYAKAKMPWQGMTISIENPAGSVRRGVDGSGKPWETRMLFDYGYLRGTEGVDGDHVDCFVGPNLDAPMVYVVHARKFGDWTAYDEDKCMIGFDSEDDARLAFLHSYNDPRFLGPITVMAVDEFVAKVRATKEKPAIVKSVVLLKSKAPESRPELVKEHKRLVAVLRSPSHEDDLEEADKQEEELEEYETMAKADYQGKQVTLNKPFRTPGGPKKFAVYVKNGAGNVVIVRFGDPNMEIKRDDPERRKNFRARHNCSDAKDPTTPAYWSCRMWSKKPVSDLAKAITPGRADTVLKYRLDMIAAQMGPLAARVGFDPEAKARYEALAQERYTIMIAMGEASI